jgi:hypothetical protein
VVITTSVAVDHTGQVRVKPVYDDGFHTITPDMTHRIPYAGRSFAGTMGQPAPGASRAISAFADALLDARRP